MSWAKACAYLRTFFGQGFEDQMCPISSEKGIFRSVQLHCRVASIFIFVNLTWNELYSTLRDWAASSSTSSCDVSFCKAYCMYPSFHFPLQEYYSRMSALWRHAINLKYDITNVTRKHFETACYMVLQKSRLKDADKGYTFRWTYIELNNKEITVCTRGCW
jgi:hypothetical protein